MTTLEGVGHSSRKGRAPLAIAAVIPVAVLLLLPWRGERLAEMPGFWPVWLTLLVGCYLLTALLLMSHYCAGASPRLLILSWAFLWAAGAALQLAVSIPGIFQQHPSFAADANSAQWLWVSRHVVPSVLIAAALAPWPAGLERRFGAREGRLLRATLSWVVIALVTFGTALVIADAPDRLWSITAGTAHRLAGVGIASVIVLNAAAVALAVWGVSRRDGQHGLERWAVVASVAFLGEVCLTAMHEDRFSVADYAARVLGLAASAFVMLAVLRDSARIQTATSEVAHRLEERNTELLEATRMRDHLSAVVSHDLRTPLAGLQGYLEMLRDDDLGSPLAKRMVERSWVLTRRLTLLTEDLLAASTLEHGDLVLGRELVDLDQQLVECASCFPDLEVELECPPGLQAYADALRLQQILTNLVRNAQKHGAEPVRIAASALPDRPGGVVIRVSDAGPGVPAAFVPRLFERYSQGAATAGGGSGLGLSVVRDLVAAHDGTIRYDAAANAFVLTLPSLDDLEALDLAPGGRGAGLPREPEPAQPDAQPDARDSDPDDEPEPAPVRG